MPIGQKDKVRGTSTYCLIESELVLELQQFITAKSPAPHHLRLQATVLMHLSTDMVRSETLRNEEASEELFYIAAAKAVQNAMYHYFTIEIKRTPIEK